MSRPQPTPQRSFFCCWVGLSFFLVISAIAQTPNSPPLVTRPENGQQLVRKAESMLQQPAADSVTQAIHLYQTAAQSFYQAGEVEAAALTWHRIAQVAGRAGDAAQAKSAAAKARTLLQIRTLPTRSSAGLSTSQAARAYLTLGRIYLESGEMKPAIEAYQTGLSLAIGARLHREAAAGQVALGLIAAQGGDFDGAIKLTANSLDFWRGAKDFGGETMALNNLARFYERKGDLRQAADYDASAINLTRFSRNHKAEGDSLAEALRLHLILGNYDEAAFECEQLIGLARLKGDQQKEHERTITLAMLEAQRENLPSAYRLLLKAFLLAPQTNAEAITQFKTFVSKLETTPTKSNTHREQLLTEAEAASGRSNFSAAYQLLLRALLMNEGKSDALNAALNARIKTLTYQIEAQQKKLAVTRPSRFD